ncbi:hypothetical protein GQ55_8G003800 [Panicum hallii var. hallii]|uniref:Uncharacterized protein n=1 Tax=Panicum hallii var. hallii TaxID=1504633 RepID=A0A2T7CJ75_9POAL|nr:hypothetical protein GQ55_8G003800 [Panicum hallii var. hallii]
MSESDEHHTWEGGMDATKLNSPCCCWSLFLCPLVPVFPSSGSSDQIRVEAPPVAAASSSAPDSREREISAPPPVPCGGQRPHRHARGPHAHQPGHRPAVRHLHPCHHGVGEIHLRPRDLAAEQRRHHRHGHAHAAAPTAYHRRLCAHEPQHQNPRAQSPNTWDNTGSPSNIQY